MEISHPRRILVLSPPSVDIAPILNKLVPPLASSSTSSSLAEPDPEPIHRISTSYYTASIPIWTDTVTNAAAWKAEWTAMQGAEDVVAAVGAWVVVFGKPAGEEEIKTLQSLLDAISTTITHHSPSTDAILLAIAAPPGIVPSSSPSSTTSTSSTLPDLEDLCFTHGQWEYIDAAAPPGLNEFGEKRGVARMLEALEAGEWDGPEGDVGVDELEEDLDGALDEAAEELGGFDPQGVRGERGAGEGILGQEGVSGEGNGGKKGVGHGDGDGDVEELQRMLGRLQAAKDLGADLPQAERRRLAREAVKGVMKEL